MSIRDNLEKMLASGQETALLRYSLGAECLKGDDVAGAAAHLARAVELDPGYSAAWKLYGKALAALDRHEEAIAVYERGVAVAEERGDAQAAKEMRVFLKRSQKALGGS
jgi:tetratricopeptide (TPR) repeat protein